LAKCSHTQEQEEFMTYHTYIGILLIDDLLHMDKEPADPADAIAYSVRGTNGIQQVMEDYEAKARNQATIPWLDSEVAMLTMQATDDNYQPVIEHLRQGRRVAYTTPNRQNTLLEFILPTTTLENAGALRVRPFQRRNDPTPVRPDKRRQLIAVPHQLVPTISHFHHQGLAHAGESRMLKTLYLRYWWCGM
jgi:hypothetical protein